MNIKRIIPCLDVKDGRLVKGVKFEGLRDVASPVDRAREYCAAGADELVFYDITASVEGRGISAEILKKVAKEVTVPFAVGGGIKTLEDFDFVMDIGADKVSINSGVISDPSLIERAAKKYGSKAVVFAIDASKVGDSFFVFADGGRKDTGIELVEWVKRGAELGAGEIVLNSIDNDGVQQGFDIPMLRAVTEAVSIPVVASGGAGKPEDFVRLFKELPEVSAGLGASVFHFGIIEIPALKKLLKENGIAVS